MESFKHLTTYVTLKVCFILIAEQYGPHALMRLISRYIVLKVRDGHLFRLNKTHTVSLLQESMYDICRFADHLLTQDMMFIEIDQIDPQMKGIVEKSQWKIYPFSLYARRVEENIAQVETLMRQSKFISLLQENHFYSLYLNILAPNTHSKWFAGVCKGYIQVWIPLRAGEVGLDFSLPSGEQHNVLRLGDVLAFDHTVSHRFRNDTSHIQIVLCMELMRPTRDPEQYIVTEIGLDVVSRHHLIDEALQRVSRIQSQ